MKNLFKKVNSEEIIRRINSLTINSLPLWGEMNVAQMMAHCNVSYEHVYDNIHPKPTGLKKLIFKLYVKKIVAGEKPFNKNMRTPPEFVIKDDRDFMTEKTRLINHIEMTQNLGETHFEGKVSGLFGKLTTTEWNNMFYKQLDHHLKQFRV